MEFVKRCLMIFLLLSLACASQPKHTSPDRDELDEVSAAPDGLRFSVRVSPSRFRPGQRVLLEASLFNEGDDDWEKDYDSSCIWDYEITNEFGDPLRAERGCLPHDSTVVLAPGELRMIVREWSGGRYFNARSVLTPGKYRVVAGFLDEARRVIPMSPPVEVEVMP
jgi:hypothetical protein